MTFPSNEELDRVINDDTLRHRKDCAEAQAKYCEDKRLPHFAPLSGNCYRCYRNIYDVMSLEFASSHLITGCPLCHATYVD